MTRAMRLYILDKATFDLGIAKYEEQELKRIASEMMKRQRGEDGWDPVAWSGEGTKARRDHSVAKRRREMIESVVKELRGSVQTKRGRRR